MQKIAPVTERNERTISEPTQRTANDLPTWETPRIEDVSEQVMAQPYIRFT